MRLIVTGPTDYFDFDTVKSVLNEFTWNADDVTLISDAPHVSFPVAHKWMLHRRALTFRKKSGRFRFTRMHHLPKRKKIEDAYKEQCRDMVQDATALVAFWEVGKVDFKVTGLFNLAELYDLQTLKVLI